MSSAYLDRFVDEQRLLAANGHASEGEQQVVPLPRYMSQTGRRAAEVHLALAARSDLIDFAPEPIRAEDARRWSMMSRRVRNACSTRSVCDATRPGSDRPLIDRLLTQRAGLIERLSTRLPQEIDEVKIRLHGDFRLRHMLIVKDDIFITGFEGRRCLPLVEAPAQRRQRRAMWRA